MDDYFKKASGISGVAAELKRMQELQGYDLASTAKLYGTSALDAARASIDPQISLAKALHVSETSLEQIIKAKDMLGENSALASVKAAFEAEQSVRTALGISASSLEDLARRENLSRLIEVKSSLDGSLHRHSEATLLKDSLAYQVAIRSATSTLENLSLQYIQSDVAAKLAAIHKGYAGSLALHASQATVEAASMVLGHQWAQRVGAFGYAYGNERATELVLESHYLSVSTAALLAQEYASRIQPDLIGTATLLPQSDFIDISDRFIGLTDAYGDLIQSYDTQDHFIASLPPVVSDGPPNEVLENAIVVNALSSDLTEEDLEKSVAVQRQHRKWDEATTDMLRALNPAFEVAYIGAMQALHSYNVDKARHVIVSLRELVTHVLHHLAPDPIIMTWIADPKHLHDGRPTRAARLYYICRAIDGGAFASFVQADVRSALACIDLYQKGTHKIESAFTEFQLQAIVTRTECMLRFLITTSRTANQ